MSEITLPDGISKDDFEMLRHCVGDANDRSTLETGWRNHYAAGEGAVPGWERLCSAGLARRRKDANDALWPYPLYHATKAGLALVRRLRAERHGEKGLRLYLVTSKSLPDERPARVWATSHAQARYSVASDGMDTYFYDTWPEAFADLRVRLAREGE